VIQNDFIEDAQDAIDLENLPPNQRSISTVILKACPTGQGQGGFQELCNDLIADALEGGSVGVPLKQITPDQSAAARAPAAETVTVQNINVNGRMAALRAGVTGFSASGFSFNLAGFNLNSSLFQGGVSGYDSINPGFTNGNAAVASNDDSFDDFGRWGIFVSGRAVFGDKDATASETGYDFNTAGLTIGIDYRFTDKFVGGVAFGYSDNNVKIDGKSGKLDSTGLTATLYGSYYPTDRFYMDVSVSTGTNDYDQQRQVDYQLSEVGAVVSETLKTDYDGDETGFTFGTGYDFSKNGWTFGPTLFVEYVDISIDAYDERLVNGGVAGFTLGWATHIKKQDYESLIPSIGFQFSKAWSRPWGVIIPQGHVSWAKELKNDDTIISGYFLGDTGQVNFELLTDALDEDFFEAGLGFSAMFPNNKSAFLMVDGDFGRDLLSVYYINAGFRWEF
jgi:outer membrane lipase/esterase